MPNISDSIMTRKNKGSKHHIQVEITGYKYIHYNWIIFISDICQDIYNELSENRNILFKKLNENIKTITFLSSYKKNDKMESSIISNFDSSLRMLMEEY